MTTLDALEALGTLAPEAVTAAAREGSEARVELLCGGRWFPVCDVAGLVPGRGVAALLPDGCQVAVFRDRHGAVHAVGNRDPFSGAHVLSRGLLGSTGGVTFVASPILKQRFDLRTGTCLEDESVSVPVYEARVR